MHILSNIIQVKAGTTQGIQFEVETTKKRHFSTHLFSSKLSKLNGKTI
jgi:hypothetical protein